MLTAYQASRTEEKGMRQVCIYLAASGSHSKPSPPLPFLGNLTCNTVQDQWGQKCLLLPWPWPALARRGHLARSSPRDTRQIPSHSPKAPYPSHPRAHWFPNVAGNLLRQPRPPLDSGGGYQALQDHVPRSRGTWGNGGSVEVPCALSLHAPWPSTPLVFRLKSTWGLLVEVGCPGQVVKVVFPSDDVRKFCSYQGRLRRDPFPYHWLL